MCENSQLETPFPYNEFPDTASAIALRYSGYFHQIPSNHLLAEEMLILPNTTSLPSAVLSVLQKNILAPAGLQRNEILWF